MQILLSSPSLSLLPLFKFVRCNQPNQQVLNRVWVTIKRKNIYKKKTVLKFSRLIVCEIIISPLKALGIREEEKRMIWTERGGREKGVCYIWQTKTKYKNLREQLELNGQRPLRIRRGSDSIHILQILTYPYLTNKILLSTNEGIIFRI